MIHRMLGDMAKAMHRNMIPDPGDAGTLAPTKWGACALVSAGAETRILSAPAYIGQRLLLYFKTDGGDCVVTCATAMNVTGDNTITFDTAGECIELVAVESGANLRWRAIACLPEGDTASLSTV